MWPDVVFSLNTPGSLSPGVVTGLVDSHMIRQYMTMSSVIIDERVLKRFY